MNLKKFGIVLAGNFLIALGVAYFLVPAGLISGGATGLSLLLHHLLPISMSSALLVCNLALFLLGAVVLGKQFALNTLIGTFAYPVFYAMTERIASVTGTPTSDPFLCMMFSGIFFGLGIGLVLREDASTGGTDIIALILNKKFGFPISPCLYALDAVILAGQMLFSDVEQILYGLLFALVYTVLINKVILLGASKIQIQIFSQQYELLRQTITSTFDLGCTLVCVEGGYTRTPTFALQVIIPQRQLFRLKEYVLTTDPKAFIVISEVSEVRGRGYTLDKHLT